MDGPPSEQQLHEEVVRTAEYEGDYNDRLEDTMSYTGIGWAGPIFLFQYFDARESKTQLMSRGLRDPSRWVSMNRTAFNLCGTIGESLRIVDDILDGDGCQKIEDRARFLDNYIDSVENGSLNAPIEVEEERIAYSSGAVLHQVFEEHRETREKVVETMSSMSAKVRTEDKSSREPYLEYAEAAGRDYGRLLMASLGYLPDVSPEKPDLSFASDYGFATQVADDRFDGDTGLDEDILKQIYFESLEDLSEHSGAIPQIVSNVGKRAPSVYNLLMEANARLVD
jgi:hypothetical protein